MSNTLLRVRQIQEEIRLHEEMLRQLTETPEYKAEQEFVKDVQDVLEMHGRTLKEAVLAIDPGLLASAPPGKTRAARTPRAPKAVTAPKPTTALGHTPKPSPFGSYGAGGDANASPENPQESLDLPGKPGKQKRNRIPRQPGEGPRSSESKQNWNKQRNEARRIDMIKGGRWYRYTNPHTNEQHEASKQNTDTLREWAAQYGKVTVESWKVVVTPDEAGL